MLHEGSPYTEFFKDRGKWLKTQSLVYRWTSGAEWVTASYEAMKMKAVNHELMIRLKGTIAFKAGRMSAIILNNEDCLAPVWICQRF
jgi:transposase